MATSHWPGLMRRSARASGDDQSAIAMVRVTVLDRTPPQITCPSALTVQCDADVPPVNVGSVTVSDDSDPSPVVTHVGDIASGTAPKTIVRTYKARDAAGNESTCTQTITVHDQTPPVVTCPLPVTVECAEQVPAPDIALV